MVWYEIYDDCYIDTDAFYKFCLDDSHSDAAEGHWTLLGYKLDGTEEVLRQGTEKAIKACLRDIIYSVRGGYE